MKRLALSLLASPLIAATLSAQDINGSLFGYLADPRGLPVAGGYRYPQEHQDRRPPECPSRRAGRLRVPLGGAGKL